MKNYVIELQVTKGKLYKSCCGDQFYKYCIHINTNDPAFSLCRSHVWRRYSEFCWLRRTLKQNYYVDPQSRLPDLPSQGLFRNRDDPDFMEERRAGLENFIKLVLELPLSRADRALHLFLQTSISIEDIEFNLNGQRHDQIIVFKKKVPLESFGPRDIPLAAQLIDQDQSPADPTLSMSLTPPSGSYRSVLKASNNNASSSPTTNKRVTFSQHIRVMTLANAWPVPTQ